MLMTLGLVPGGVLEMLRMTSALSGRRCWRRWRRAKLNGFYNVGCRGHAGAKFPGQLLCGRCWGRITFGGEVCCRGRLCPAELRACCTKHYNGLGLVRQSHLQSFFPTEVTLGLEQEFTTLVAEDSRGWSRERDVDCFLFRVCWNALASAHKRASAGRICQEYCPNPADANVLAGPVFRAVCQCDLTAGVAVWRCLPC